MNQKEILFALMNKNNGMITMSYAEQKGIRKNIFGELVKSGELSKVAPGLYSFPEEDIDEYIQISYRVPQGIFSHDTAAYLHGLTTRMPLVYIMTVKSGSNITRIKKDMLPVEFRYIDKKYIELGSSEIETPFGRKVKVYDKERTILDFIRYHNKDSGIFSEVLNNYFKGNEKDLYRLATYASKMNLEQKLKRYTEVLL